MLLPSSVLLLIFYLDSRDCILLREDATYLPNHTALQTFRHYSALWLVFTCMCICKISVGIQREINFLRLYYTDIFFPPFLSVFIYFSCTHFLIFLWLILILCQFPYILWNPGVESKVAFYCIFVSLAFAFGASLWNISHPIIQCFRNSWINFIALLFSFDSSSGSFEGKSLISHQLAGNTSCEIRQRGK